MKIRASLVAYCVSFALLLNFAMLDTSVQAETNWTKYAGNPILVGGAADQWDWFILHPNVLEVPTGYSMFFTAQNFSAGVPRLRVGFATAPDKVTWTKHPANPVMDIGPMGSWEEVGVGVPWVTWNGTMYTMWYTGFDFGFSPQIGLASSLDGVTWFRYPLNPVIPRGNPTDWDGGGTAAASVTIVGPTYHAWYMGVDTSGDSRIGYATSPNGWTWTKSPLNPVLDLGGLGEWDSQSIGLPCVIFDGVTYRMWYTGQDGSGLSRIGYATSTDGTSWTKYIGNPVLEEGLPGEWDENGPMGSSVLIAPGGYDMWYGSIDLGGNSGFGYANSTAIQNPPELLNGQVTPPTGPVNSAFAYNVTYRDVDNDPAANVRLWINKSGIPFGSSPYDMKLDNWVGAPDDWTAGANYAISVNLFKVGNDYTLAFSASDGTDTAFYPEQAGPEVTAISGVDKLLFMSNRSGNMDIWLMNVDGSSPIQLTTDPWDDLFPDWSPDSQKIAYANWNGTNSDIWVMDADGSNKTRLTTHPAGDFNPVWSPDGTRIAFNSRRDGGDSDIWVMDADGSNKVQLTTNTSDDRHATWSPDCTKIAFSTDRITPNDNDIWVMDADGSNKTEIQSFPGYDLAPDWSPDGSKIAWNSRVLGEHDIWVMDPDGSNQTRLTTHPEEDASPSWSHDSSRIAYYSVQLGNPEIFVMDADGSNQTQLTVDPAADLDPDFGMVPDKEPPLPPELNQAVLSGMSGENVEITWNASADEGQPGGTTRYEIWRAMDYAGPYSYIDEVPADGSPSYTYADAGTGHGDPNVYFYKIYSADAMDNKIPSTGTAGKYTRQLQAGINFISIPLVQVDETLQTVLQTVNFDKAWFYDSQAKDWMYYVSFKPYKTDLGRMDHRMGIWVETTGASNLTVAGMAPAQTNIQLRTGWNLVSFPSFNSTYTVSDLIADTGATRVEGYDPGSPYCLKVLVPTDVIETGFAYWVRVEADMVWTIESA